MSRDNNFLAHYSLDIDVKELVEQVTEEISYDIGLRHVGTGFRAGK